MLQAATTSFKAFFALRFLLGMCESCVAPILILIISMFYKKDEQGVRISWFYVMVCSRIIKLLFSAHRHIPRTALHKFSAVLSRTASPFIRVKPLLRTRSYTSFLAVSRSWLAALSFFGSQTLRCTPASSVKRNVSPPWSASEKTRAARPTSTGRRTRSSRLSWMSAHG